MKDFESSARGGGEIGGSGAVAGNCPPRQKCIKVGKKGEVSWLAGWLDRSPLLLLSGGKGSGKEAFPPLFLGGKREGLGSSEGDPSRVGGSSGEKGAKEGSFPRKWTYFAPCTSFPPPLTAQ